MELKEVVLYFIDCNAMTIDAKCINGIYLGGITESLSGFDGKINKTISAADFALYVDKAADKVIDDDSICSRTYFNTLEFYHNIYSVTLVYEEVIDGVSSIVKKEYEVYWDDIHENPNSNPSQNTYITSDGNLCVVISKDKDLDNFFEVYRDEDEDYEKLSSDDIEFHL